MSLSRLRATEMLVLARSWLDPESRAGKAIAKEPVLAAAVRRLAQTCDELNAATQPRDEKLRIAEISNEQKRVDARHDDILRGIHGLLGSSALLLGGDAAQELIEIRNALLPGGLESVNASYIGEAGAADLLSRGLTPAVKAQLEGIRVGPVGRQKALRDFIEEWISLAKRLGKLEDEKARLGASAAEAPSAASASKARNEWVRTVNAMLAAAELIDLDAETDALLFGPLRAAAKLAGRRGSSSSASKRKLGATR
jgi:hypothetical protein